MCRAGQLFPPGASPPSASCSGYTCTALERREMGDFGATPRQPSNLGEQAAWLGGSSWVQRAPWHQVSSSDEAGLASCGAAKTAMFDGPLHGEQRKRERAEEDGDREEQRQDDEARDDEGDDAQRRRRCEQHVGRHRRARPRVDRPVGPYLI